MVGRFFEKSQKISVLNHAICRGLTDLFIGDCGLCARVVAV